ncbi:endopeptidase La [Malassezia caprae]|uniref:Endopeptidase La n=1 Tax=Malassezia caprae TaxID=1381934 RepID=A0AAF0E316_9BASI|nr:endopeptidase La [Malassezia caprae]
MDDNTAGDEVKELADRLKQASMPLEARKVCERELRRLKKMPSQSMERGVLINYLDTMLDLPWDRRCAQISQAELSTLVPSTQAVIDPSLSLVKQAEKVLEADHYGLEKVKKRILEYLAVLQLKSEQAEEQAKSQQASMPEGTAPPKLLNSMASNVSYKGPILLLVGPPGTGKTSIARSLAAALQRPFVRLSLGGVRDEAEIRGHRRTYVGALPGSIVSSLRKARASDCVMLLDELDKLSSGMGMHGDPTAAMLEVLDPEQNHAFKDHYLNVPVDLSRVVFIATANSLDTIPEPLLDRVDVVHIAGYTYDEKVAIAQKHLLPKQVSAQGLENKLVEFDEGVLLKIAMSYTREAGVRTMERRIGDIVRAKAVEYATQRHTSSSNYQPHVSVEDMERFLGPPTYEPEITDSVGTPGVATGMAYQGSGTGAILHIECAFLPAGTAALKLTGSLGDVIRESAELAFAWVKSHAFALGITADRDASFPQNDVHLHMPSGATPKDGPSAGVAFVCALVSMYLRVSLDTRLAMTGEITLRGYVTPVGGIKEKVIGAHRAGVRKVILPQRNQRDVEADIPAPVRAEMDVVYVRTIQDALHAVFGASLETQISTLHGDIEARRRLQELEWQSRL